LLGAAVEGFGAPKPTFIQNVTRVLDQIMEKDPDLYSAQWADQIMDFLEKEWTKGRASEKEFLQLMHTKPEFLETLGTCKDEKEKKEASDLIRKGHEAYENFKQQSNIHLDPAKVCLKAMGFVGQWFFLSSAIIKKYFGRFT